LGTRVSFILGVHDDLGRQIAELIADVPATLAATNPLERRSGLMEVIRGGIMQA